MMRNKTARQHNFATVPRADIPRSKFRMRQTRKQAFNASELVPIMCEEVLPGDTWQHRESIVARFPTPIAPLVDDIDVETFYYFVPNRIAWAGPNKNEGWEAFITGANTALTVPTITPVYTIGPTLDVITNGIFDHFGILPALYTTDLQLNALPIFGYFMIYNEWFRDQNLQEPWVWADTWTDDYSNNITLETTGTAYNQQCLRINKRHDYFTSSLPWPQKGAAVTIPLGTTAPVIPTTPNAMPTFWGVTSAATRGNLIGGAAPAPNVGLSAGSPMAYENIGWDNPNLITDLSAATAQTINSLRLAALTQKLLEADARGGSRYVEQILVHFGVRAPDYMLNRPQYLGGSRTPITINPIAQTAAYDAEPADEASAVGNLGAEMHASSSRKTFTYGAVEHGYIIGLAAVRATPTYQQGTRRHWRRQTRLDFWFPEFDGLGEQAVSTLEIWQPPNNTPAVATWGYQERAAEYRYTPNEITGVLRSTNATPMDWWHLAEEFQSEPALNNIFIADKTQEALTRSLATYPTEQWSAQVVMDILHDSIVARLMPTYGVPGIDRF